MDINLYIEGLRQSQEKTSHQKDILDTWEEIQKVPFDRQTAIKQAKKNKLNYSNLREKTSPLLVIGTRPWEELYDKDIRITVGRLLIFQQSARFLWANLAQLIGKYRCGQRGQPALTSTRTLLSGTTICSCLVGTGGYLYCRRTF